MTPALQQHLAEKIAASEATHQGQICIYVEGGLPAHCIWSGESARARAIALFGKTGVWDTEHNNGVLIYLLMAEHAIEIVADRGLRQRVDANAWQDAVAHLAEALRSGRYEAGLDLAIDEVSALLAAHFPAPDGRLGQPGGNELPDAPRFR